MSTQEASGATEIRVTADASFALIWKVLCISVDPALNSNSCEGMNVIPEVFVDSTIEQSCVTGLSKENSNKTGSG